MCMRNENLNIATYKKNIYSNTLYKNAGKRNLRTKGCNAKNYEI